MPIHAAALYAVLCTLAVALIIACSTSLSAVLAHA